MARTKQGSTRRARRQAPRQLIDEALQRANTAGAGTTQASRLAPKQVAQQLIPQMKGESEGTKSKNFISRTVVDFALNASNGNQMG